MEAIKRRFPDAPEDDLRRFLLARDGDVEKAITMYANHLEWKRNNWPVLKSSCANEISKGKMFLLGQDREGHPLLYWRVSLNDPDHRDLEEQTRMVLWWMEVAIAAIPANSTDKKIAIVLDRTHFVKKNMDIAFLKYLTKIMSDNYPERLARAYVSPAGVVFWSIWQIVQMFVDPKTRAKVLPLLYLSGLNAHIDPSNIIREMDGQSRFSFEADMTPSDPYSFDLIADGMSRGLGECVLTHKSVDVSEQKELDAIVLDDDGTHHSPRDERKNKKSDDDDDDDFKDCA